MEIPNYTYIQHKLKQRPWGCECQFTVKDGERFIDEVISIPTLAIVEADLIERISSRLSQMKEREDYEATFSHFFDDCGQEVKEALFWMVRKIRQNPNATLAQAQTAWNTEWADSIFTFDKLVAYFRNRVQGITWAEFKTYVINHRFVGVD